MKERKPLGPGSSEPKSHEPSANAKGPSNDTGGAEPTMGIAASMSTTRNASLGRDIQSKIGLQLRAYYDSLLDPVPSRFTELLSRLDKMESKDRSNES